MIIDHSINKQILINIYNNSKIKIKIDRFSVLIEEKNILGLSATGKSAIFHHTFMPNIYLYRNRLFEQVYKYIEKHITIHHIVTLYEIKLISEIDYYLYDSVPQKVPSPPPCFSVTLCYSFLPLFCCSCCFMTKRLHWDRY